MPRSPLALWQDLAAYHARRAFTSTIKGTDERGFGDRRFLDGFLHGAECWVRMIRPLAMADDLLFIAFLEYLVAEMAKSEAESGMNNMPSDIEIKRAQREAGVGCRHCWHSESDKMADRHDASCCRCGAQSNPTEDSDNIPCPHCGSLGPGRCACVGAVVGRPAVPDRETKIAVLIAAMDNPRFGTYQVADHILNGAVAAEPCHKRAIAIRDLLGWGD